MSHSSGAATLPEALSGGPSPAPASAPDASPSPMEASPPPSEASPGSLAGPAGSPGAPSAGASAAAAGQQPSQATTLRKAGHRERAHGALRSPGAAPGSGSPSPTRTHRIASPSLPESPARARSSRRATRRSSCPSQALVPSATAALPARASTAVVTANSSSSSGGRVRRSRCRSCTGPPNRSQSGVAKVTHSPTEYPVSTCDRYTPGKKTTTSPASWITCGGGRVRGAAGRGGSGDGGPGAGADAGAGGSRDSRLRAGGRAPPA